MKRVLCLLLFITSYSAAQTGTFVRLSEIMFYPSSGNNEFIELYNTSSTESIDLSDFKIKYYSASPDIISDAGEGTMLTPLTYAVILEGDYDFSSGIYNDLIPGEALLLKISDNSFGSTGMANTADRPIWLLSASNDTIDIYTYTADNSQSHSDEKIYVESDSSQTNWLNSIPLNGTPGFKNSVTPVNFDLSISAVKILPLIPVQGDDISIEAIIKNQGENTAESFNVKIFNDTNLDSVPQNNEQIYSQEFFNLNPVDSVIASTGINSASTGIYNIIVKIIYTPDEDTLDNMVCKDFIVYPQGSLYNDVVINEIMYAPYSGEPEWIEIYNRTPSAININKWKFSDEDHTVTITYQDFIIPGNSFVVLTKDSSILNYYSVTSEIIEFNLPALNNTGDAVVIKDSLGNIIDSLVFTPDWGGGEGRSLERISVNVPGNQQDNWHTSESIFKATPGEINSVTPKNNDLKIFSFTTQDYGIVGEPVEFEINIKNEGLNLSPEYSLSLYNDVNQDSIPQSSELISSLNSTPLSPGDSIKLYMTSPDCHEGDNYYIMKLNVSADDDTTNNIAYTNMTGILIYEQRNDLVINEFMYDPDSPQPEWLEIFNRSNKIIDLKNYRMADGIDTVIVNRNSLIIYPDEYAVISSDSSILNYFNITSLLIVKSLPALNNSGDKIILLDSLNLVIDSLEYSDEWGGKDGKSMERIDPENPSTDPVNWASTRSRNNGTPGFINTVTKKFYDISVDDIIPSPLFPVFGDNTFLKIKINNYGMNPGNFSLKLYEDTDLDSIPEVLLQTISNLSLQQDDSLIIETEYTIDNLQSLHCYYAEAIFKPDMDTSNNYLIKNISPGYPASTILINEIMYSPSGGEPEWVEIFNTSGDSISLMNWFVSDIITTPSHTEIKSEIRIPPENYLLLAKDSSILNYHRFILSGLTVINLPVLNNDADGFLLKDSRGQTMDSVFFRKDWGGTGGFSLERISIAAGSNVPSNWGTSEDIENSTPGRVNSITPKANDIIIAKISSRPEFPVSGDTVFISALIKNKGSHSASGIRVEFRYDSDSDYVPDKILSAQSDIKLNPEDSIYVVSTESIQNLSAGILTAVQAYSPADEDTLNNYAERFIQYGFANREMIINEIMYDPPDGEPEWIELLNISTDSINLKNWMVSDLLSTPSRNFITGKDFYLQPDNFVVISRDTSFHSYHPDVKNVLISNFGILGNSDDGAMIYDFRDAVIDSVHYKSEWGGKNGYSLERISACSPSEEKSNWASCLSSYKSTPGKENSIENIPSTERNSVIINEIMFDAGIDNCEFIEFYNRSADSINIGGWQMEDEKGNSIRLTDSAVMIKSGDYFLLSADSIILKKYDLKNFFNISFAGSSDLGLSNDGELILLKDVKGSVVDSVIYSSNWTNRDINITKNKSLERINPGLNGNYPDNWSTCVNPEGATPGKQNSIFTDNSNKISKISVSPNPFSPDNDGFEDFSIINYSLTQSTSQIRIKIFDNRGRLVRTVANNQPTASHGSIVFDGLGDDGQVLRMGIYIIFLEALNKHSGAAEILKTVVVIARKL
ncbi:MAG TPA: lamin tail domain-containing protein [Ignavibacteriaceae bacterium]|nr:lamin tail domain-containing protein [Ignavibacteriaceae bacterium]